MKSHIIAFDNLWQTPAKTELHAFNQLKAIDTLDEEYCYVAYPWATLIDFLQTGKPIPDELVTAFDEIKTEAAKAVRTKKLITTCQHIFASRYISLFKACRISTLYWSHCTISEPEIGGIAIQPFPLYAVHEPGPYEVNLSDSIKSRPIKASFIGAYDSRYYITDIRKEILSISETAPKDYLIIARDNWHFQEEVYKNQISGNALEDAITEIKHQEKMEYKNALKKSLFSLCPSGSGPNSIRLWETLAFNSIPVIFADTLALPGSVQDWIEASVFLPEATKREDIIRILDSHASKQEAELKAKAEAAARINKRYGNSYFIWDILNLKTSKTIFVDTTQISTEVRSGLLASGSHPSLSGESQNKEPHRTLVIDPGLKDTGSHHDKINRSTISALKKPIVLSHIASTSRSSEFTYKVRPVFSSTIYDENAASSSMQYIELINSFAIPIVSEIRRSTAIESIYLHTATASLIQGLAHAIQVSKRQSTGLQSVYVQLMFNPYSLLSPFTRETSAKADARYRAAIKKLIRVCFEYDIKLCIETSNRVFQELYRKLLCSEDIGLHPHVFANSQSTNGISQVDENAEILLHSGDPRPGKGLEWLGESLEYIINNTDASRRLLIHSGALRYPSAFLEIQDALQSIQMLAKRYPNKLRFLTGRLDDEEWLSILINSSRSYLLHSPDFYRFRTSGNFFDIMTQTNGSIPIYLTSDTLSLDIARSEMLNHGQVDYADSGMLVKSINENAVSPPSTSKGFPNFKAAYMHKDHAIYVSQKLSTPSTEYA